jgi:hypothetical protein
VPACAFFVHSADCAWGYARFSWRLDVFRRLKRDRCAQQWITSCRYSCQWIASFCQWIASFCQWIASFCHFRKWRKWRDNDVKMKIRNRY